MTTTTQAFKNLRSWQNYCSLVISKANREFRFTGLKTLDIIKIKFGSTPENLEYNDNIGSIYAN